MLASQIESILFVSAKPLTVQQIFNFLKKNVDILLVGSLSENKIREILVDIENKLNVANSGTRIVKSEDTYQMVSNPENGELIKNFLKAEVSGELTPASLETLTVIAYRGPIRKLELEELRGVNCSVILRNLLMRGLVEEQQEHYQVTVDFLKNLGLSSAKDLPDYEKLNKIDITNLCH